MRDFIPQTQLFGATAAVLHYAAASRVIATVAVRWLGIVCFGYFDDSGIADRRACIKEALDAFTRMNSLLGFQLRNGKREAGISRRGSEV